MIFKWRNKKDCLTDRINQVNGPLLHNAVIAIISTISINWQRRQPAMVILLKIIFKSSHKIFYVGTVKTIKFEDFHKV